jgi:thiamine pyrophosphate-dependent acetolactate synthase large subunit-like protein
MPSFKPKSSKKIKFNKKSAITLDIKHKEFLNEFSKDENIVTDYKYQIQILKKKLEDENRRKRQAKRQEENMPRFAPLYEAKMNSEIKNNKKKK